MFTVQTVRFEVKAAHTAEFENAVNRIIGALQRSETEGIQYTMCKAGEGSFLGILQLSKGAENPLHNVDEGRAFLAGLQPWLAVPPERAQWLQLANFNSLGEIEGKQ